jgi:hypothetical protein
VGCQPRDEKKAVAHRRSDGRDRAGHERRDANIGTEWRAGSSCRRSRLDPAGVHLRENFHVRQNRRELRSECVGARGIDAEARQPGDVKHVVARDRHYSCPRSRVVYASLIVFLPTFTSSKSMTAFTSLPRPDTSAMDPSPKGLCFTLSPFT